jgi:hypothetical protein
MRLRRMRPWTDIDLAKLKSMAQKESTARIAKTLGRTKGATAMKAHELGLSLRLNPANDDGRLRSDLNFKVSQNSQDAWPHRPRKLAEYRR